MLAAERTCACVIELEARTGLPVTIGSTAIVPARIRLVVPTSGEPVVMLTTLKLWS
jgi:hypothetical protein